MPVYAYRARDTQGQPVDGTLEVSTEGELVRRLDAQGLLLTTVRKVRAPGKLKHGRLRLRRKELIALTYNLETIYTSGIPLVEGLQDLSRNSGSRATCRVAAALAEDIRSGAHLAKAMQRHPRVFPDVYRSVVEAGESAGEPGPVLKKLAEYYHWVGEMRSTAVRALTYPLVLGGAVCGLILLLLTFLVPRILKVLAHMNEAMPLPTRILMAVSDFLKDNIVILLAAAAAAAIGVALVRRTANGRLLIDRLKLRIPVLGTLAGKISAARFANTVSMLYQAGIGTVQALETGERVMGNAFMAAGVRDARDAVTQGETFADALRNTNAFQPLVVRMIRIGEQTGTLGEALDRVNAFYDREVPQTIKNLLSLLEPAMIVAAGLAVGFILLCTFLPMFQMVGSLGR